MGLGKIVFKFLCSEALLSNLTCVVFMFKELPFITEFRPFIRY